MTEFAAELVPAELASAELSFSSFFFVELGIAELGPDESVPAEVARGAVLPKVSSVVAATEVGENARRIKFGAADFSSVSTGETSGAVFCPTGATSVFFTFNDV